MPEDWPMPYAGRRARAADIDPVTEIVDAQPTEIVDPQPTEIVDPQPTEIVDPQPTEIVERPLDDPTEVVREQAVDVETEVIRTRDSRPFDDDQQETRAISQPTPMAPIKPVWRGSADVRTPERDPYGSSSWTTWIAPRLRRRAWWLPIALGVAGIMLLLTAAFILVHASASGAAAPPEPTATAGR